MARRAGIYQSPSPTTCSRPGSATKPREIFGFDAIPVGSFNLVRKAVPVAGGYRTSGRTGFVSGAQHATVFLGFATIHDDGEPRCGADGAPAMLLTAVPASEA